MKVILANTLGFCAGVRKAVNLIYSQVEKEDCNSLFMEGPIIHNSSVIKDLTSKGVSLLESNSDINGKKVVVRAHGITPDRVGDLEHRGASIIDGTCPIVKASQIKIKKYNDEGYFIVISGDKGHAEVIGLVGQAPNNTVVVASPSDVANLVLPAKTVLISQTTFSKPEFYIIEKVLKEKCPTLVTLCTICGATNERQEAVVELAKHVEAMLVVGGLTSSNTGRLKSAVCDMLPTWLIEDASQIPPEIQYYNVVGVTAGASTPDNIIEDVVKMLENY